MDGIIGVESLSSKALEVSGSGSGSVVYMGVLLVHVSVFYR